MLLAEMLIAHVGNESKTVQHLEWDDRRVSFWYFSIKGIDVVIIKLISWYGKGSRGGKSILRSRLSYSCLFFSLILRSPTLVLWTQVTLDKAANQMYKIIFST